MRHTIIKEAAELPATAGVEKWKKSVTGYEYKKFRTKGQWRIVE
jgi:hypothetical protein